MRSIISLRSNITRRKANITEAHFLTEGASIYSPFSFFCSDRGLTSSAAKQATHTELRAMQAERSCEDCYKAAYMEARIGEEFDGMISSVAPQGAYVELENTVEGLIRTEALGEAFSFDGLIELSNPFGESYRVGDAVRVVCVRVDVASGQIDFELADETD